jgi:hypothetical protein
MSLVFISHKSWCFKDETYRLRHHESSQSGIEPSQFEFQLASIIKEID